MNTTAVSQRITALDWLKAAGMTIIVWGHVIGLPSLNAVAPIYIKQFGVAFFCFVTGYTVARDTRPWTQVLRRRLYEPWVVGFGCAVLLSIVAYFRIGTIQKSNYVPFLAGVNVFLNFFPANPTTWYLGCYLHILLAAAWFRRSMDGWGRWAALAAVEIVIRAALLTSGRLFMSYMLLPNWTASIALGTVVARREPPRSVLAAAGVLAVVLALVVRPAAGTTFPFMLPAADIATLARASAAITFLYCGVSAVVYSAASLVRRRVWLVSLIADNTLLIFILHMPIYYIVPAVLTSHPRTFLHGFEAFLICLVVPLLVSMAFRRWVPLSPRRQRPDAAYAR